MRVVLNDVNDNYPIFEKSLYTIRILESAAIGELLVRVQATDADAGNFGSVTYSFLNDFGRFSFVDCCSGSIVLSGALDYETLTEYNVTVIASDKGSPALTSRAVVQVIVLDVNDNAPTFLPASANVAGFSCGIMEGLSSGALCVDVDAEDKVSWWLFSHVLRVRL